MAIITARDLPFVLAYAGTGLAGAGWYDVPKGVVFASPTNYAARLTQSLKASTPVILRGIGENLVSNSWTMAKQRILPPIQAQLQMMKATFESATGLKLSDISDEINAIINVVNAVGPKAILNSIGDLIQGTLAIATKVMKALGVAAEALQAIPYIGLAIGISLGIVNLAFAIFGDAQAKTKQLEDVCQANASAEAQQVVPKWEEYFAVKASRANDAQFPNGVTPADIFRPLYYAWHRDGGQYRNRLPFTTLASLYVGLCASESDYKSFGYPDSDLDTQTKQTMWTLCLAMFDALHDPNEQDPKHDSGVGAFTMLQEIVRYNYAIGKITDEFLHELTNSITSRWKVEVTTFMDYPWPQKDAQMTCTDGVYLPSAKLVEPFKASLGEFEKRMGKFWNEETGTWSLSPAGVALPPLQTTGMIVMDDKTALTMGSSIHDILTPKKKAMPTWQKGVLAATGVSGGYLAYEGIKRFGPKRR